MTDPHALTAESLLRALPEVLRADPVALALATAIAAEIEEAVCKTSLASIYARIDELDEPLLDILAKDFKVDWWRADAPIEEKRYTLKTSWYINKRYVMLCGGTGCMAAGTMNLKERLEELIETYGLKDEVETAIRDFIGSGVVQEWYEYGGKPHHYRIKDGNNTAIAENYSQFLSVLRVVSRGSSVLDHITALLEYSQTIYVGMCLRIRKSVEIGCATPDIKIYKFLLDENDNRLLTPDGGLIYL